MPLSYHDTIFKETQKNRDSVIDLLQAVLPIETFKKLNINTLTIDETAYTDEELSNYFSDLVYNCEYNKNNIKISFLFEHKSSIDENIYFQVHNYISKIWNIAIKQDEKPAPVITILFYHGDKEWNIGSIIDNFKGISDDIKKYIPNFELLVVDLQKYNDDEIVQVFKNVSNQILFLIMKNIKDVKKIKRNIIEYLELGKQYYNKNEGRLFLISIIKYLFNILSLNKTEKKEMIKKIDEIINKQGGNIAMTVAMQLKQEGRVEGEIEDKQKVLIRLLSKKFNISESEKEYIKLINAPDKLDNAIDEFVFANNSEDVLNCLR